MPSHFKISEIRLLNAKYSINENIEMSDLKKNDEIPVKVDFRCLTKFIEENLELKIILGASTEDESLPFRFDVEMGGSFLFDSKPTKEVLERLSYINCPAIIFPFLREFVSDLTKRGGDDPIYLPIMNFVDHYKKSKEDTEKKSIPDTKPS
jgi:preprotein translocase subunit SecB